MNPQDLQLAGRRILVTGASGFIGSHLCQRLIATRGDVHAISRGRHTSSGITWWQGDLANAATVERIVSLCRPDILFHLASHVRGSRDPSLVMPMLRDNLLTTVNVLQATAGLGTRIVLAGSMEDPLPGNEPVPCSPYAAAKWAAAGYARMFASLNDAQVIITRLFMVYGPAQHDERKLVPYVIRSLLRGESPKLSSGRRPVDWIFVDDVVDGLVAAAVVERSSGETVDIGSGHLTTVRSVVESLGQLVAPFVPLQFGALEDRQLESVRKADVALTHTLIGWEPQVALEEGLKRTVTWYRSRFGFDSNEEQINH